MPMQVYTCAHPHTSRRQYCALPHQQGVIFHTCCAQHMHACVHTQGLTRGKGQGEDGATGSTHPEALGKGTKCRHLQGEAQGGRACGEICKVRPSVADGDLPASQIPPRTGPELVSPVRERHLPPRLDQGWQTLEPTLPSPHQRCHG